MINGYSMTYWCSTRLYCISR